MRIKRSVGFLRWLAWLALAFVLFINSFWAFRPHDLFDLGSFIASGGAKNVGFNPYGIVQYKEAGVFLVEIPHFTVYSPNLNPPVSVYVFQAYTRFEPHDLQRGMAILTIYIYIVTLALLARAYPDKRKPLMIMWAASLAGIAHVVELGQVYAPLLMLVTVAWLVLRNDRDSLTAGILIGLAAAIKPTFLIWPVLLFLAGDRKTSLSSIATAAGISAVPLLLDGPRIYHQWFDATQFFAAQDGYAIPGNAALIGLGARVGLEPLGWVAAVALLAGCACWCYRKRPTREQASILAMIAVLLVGPISWSGYTLFMLPVFFARPWDKATVVSAAMLAFPMWLMLALYHGGAVQELFFSSMYCWALLLVLYSVAKPRLATTMPILSRREVLVET